MVLVGFTISLHIAGMYAFSPVFGWLSDRIGKLATVLLGQGILVTALLVAGFGSEDHTYISIGLFLIGLGWSAATVSGSAMLAETVPLEQKTNVQGVSDMMMMLAGALGGAVAGNILALVKFVGLNLASLVPVVIVVLATALISSRASKRV